MSRANARLNNPTSRSVRLVTPESSGGQDRLYAGAFWSEPGADAGWAFVAGDPDQNTMAGGIPHLGDHDEVYLCLAGRILADWEGDGETRLVRVRGRRRRPLAVGLHHPQPGHQRGAGPRLLGHEPGARVDDAADRPRRAEG